MTGSPFPPHHSRRRFAPPPPGRKAAPARRNTHLSSLAACCRRLSERSPLLRANGRRRSRRAAGGLRQSDVYSAALARVRRCQAAPRLTAAGVARPTARQVPQELLQQQSVGGGPFFSFKTVPGAVAGSERPRFRLLLKCSHQSWLHTGWRECPSLQPKHPA